MLDWPATTGSCWEAGPPRPPAATQAGGLLAQILAQTQETAALVNRVEGDLDAVKAGQMSGVPGGSPGPSALETAQQLSSR